MSPLATLSGRRLVILATEAAMVIAVVPILCTSCTNREPGPVASTSNPAARERGVSADALDWSGSGIPIDQAISKSGLRPDFPSRSAVGVPVKIVLDETSSDETGRCGLMVLYDSGIKLKVAPGQTDLRQVCNASGADPFTDGRRRPFELSTVAGGERLILRAGTQRTTRGLSRVQSRITWNRGGITYVLEAPDGVSVDELSKAADSIQAQ